MGPIVIIGNGISGITAARHIRKRSIVPIVVISEETEYFFSRTALMYVFMGHMKFEHTKPYEDWFWEKNNIQLLQTRVESVEFNGRTILLSSGDSLVYDKLILATGSTPNRFGWPGQALKGVQSLYSYQDLELLEEAYARGIKRAVIVGGGLIGVELAEMLLSRNVPVTFLVRENCFWGNVLPEQESNLIGKHMVNDHHIDLRFNSSLKGIMADDDGWAKAVVIEESGEKIDCDFVGLTAGVRPNVDFLKNTELEIDRGILVNEFLETNMQHVFAIGDCAQFREPINGRRPVEQVWYTGRMMGECVAQTITELKTPYMPGVWFNSAKFFDIEYQTYGWVFSKLRAGEEEFYWEHASGKICLHAVYKSDNQQLLGVNVFGIRLRHHVMDDFIKNEKTLEHFISYFKDACFDPEFYKSYAKPIRKAYQEKFNTKPKLYAKRWKRIMKSVNS